MATRKPNYKRVSIVDVNELLSFAKTEYHELEEQIKEEKRVEDELKVFIKAIEKHSKHKIHYIGHEKRHGKHLIRFLFKKGGFLEVMVEKPLAINAHFLNEEHAEKFAHGLKKALHEVLPENKVKDMVINDVKVEDGFKEDVLTFDKWSTIHKIAIKKTVVVTVFTILFFVIMEIVEMFTTETTKELFNLPSVLVSIVIAVIVAFFFIQIKEKLEDIIDRIFYF